jgi:hypothetical protein
MDLLRECGQDIIQAHRLDELHWLQIPCPSLACCPVPDDSAPHRSPHRAVRRYFVSARPGGWWRCGGPRQLLVRRYSRAPSGAPDRDTRTPAGRSSFSRFACTVHLQVARTCCDRDLGLNPLLITVSCVVVGSARGGDVFPSPPLLFVRCQLACRTAANAGASCGARVLASGRSGRGPTLTARTAPTHRASRCSVA